MKKITLYPSAPSPWTAPVVFLALLLLWELCSRTGLVSSLYLPSPSSIGAAFLLMAADGELYGAFINSVGRILGGYAIGSLLGIALGMLFGISRQARAVGMPLVHFLYPVPKLALLPLFILWFGIGETPKLILIAMGVFFPVLINTYSGVTRMPVIYTKVSVICQLTDRQYIRRVVLPAAMPSIFTGLRLGAGISLILLVAAEMLAAGKGIGALVLHYGDLMLTDRLMACVVLLALMGLVFQAVLNWLEKRYIPWDQEHPSR